MPYQWIIITLPALILGLVLFALAFRRSVLREHAEIHSELSTARQSGTHTARLLHPVIDHNKCIGCGACTRACPENGVLALRHGQAVVVHGSKCVGHGECASACPTGAIMLTLGDLSHRRDLPAIDRNLEVVGVPGLYLAGELSGYALVRTAVTHGTAVANAVARQIAEVKAPSRSLVLAGSHHGSEHDTENILDLLIVGAGPGGIACSLRARQLELQFATIEQEPHIGGTIASYPRKKLVMTQPLELPMYGWLRKLSYSKEELIEIWEELEQKFALPIHTNTKLLNLSRADDGTFIAVTTSGIYRARHVSLSLGRRGSPRKLNIPGEDLPKVSYSLLDAASYENQKILIVGGGDSAIEAALALSIQKGNEVTLSYRKSLFTRVNMRNIRRLYDAIEEKKINVIYDSDLLSIHQNTVQLKTKACQQTIINDEVFIFAGGEPPFELLERAGVSFDPAKRPIEEPEPEKFNDLMVALTLTFIGSLCLIIWYAWYGTYYAETPDLRSIVPEHRFLRSSGVAGFTTGVLACLMFAANLAYLVRRSTRWGKYLPGTLRTWMVWHVLTGLSAVLLLFVHSGFTIRPTVGGHAMIALGLVIATGSVGRYLYAQFPRAANGREATIDELRQQIINISSEWDEEGMEFAGEVRQAIDELVVQCRWRGSVLARIGALTTGQFRLRRCLARLHQLGRDEDVPEPEIRHILTLARKAHQLSLLVMHYDEIGAIVSLWRYFHRWLGLLLILLTIIHIVTATRYASINIGLIDTIKHLLK